MKRIIKKNLFLLLTIFFIGTGLAFADDVIKLGDVDGNGTVDIADVTLLVNYLHAPSTTTINETAADANHDAVIDIGDVTAINNIIHFGSPTGSGATTSVLYFPTATVDKTYGDASFTNAIVRAGSSGAITYASDDTEVATVDENTGEVTIIGVGDGSAVITATLAADATYSGTTASFTLNVSTATISSVTIADLDAPVKGSSLDTEASCTTASVGIVSAVSWKIGESEASGDAQANKVYTASVTLTAGSNYAFASAPTANAVSGKDATVTRTDDTHITVSYTFDATAKNDIAPTLNLVGWTYGDAANTTPTLTGNDGNGEVAYQYKLTSADDNAYTTFDNTHYPTAAGGYTLKATVAANGDYNGGEATTTFTIAKKVPAATDFNYTAPTSLVYDGNAKSATIAAKEGITGMGTVTVKYYSGETEATPTEVGAYTVKIAVAAGDNYAATTSDLTDGTWAFAITAASFTPVVTLASWIYGSPNNPSVGETNTSGGTVTYYYKTGEADWTTTKPTAVGTHKVKASIAANGNYAAVESDPVDFTISQLEASLSWTDTSFDYDGTEKQPTCTVSNIVSGDECIVTVTGGQTNAGTYTATASGLSNGNYKLPASATQEFTINKAAVTLTCSTDALSFTALQGANSTVTKTGVSCTGGTISVISGTDANCTVSYSDGTITVTRVNTAAFDNTVITVSVTPDDNHTAPSSVTFSVSAVAALPAGELPGKFTINAGGGQVSFSKGNLQYQASTDTWRFATNQYDMIGGDNANISESYTGWIDLFGWGTGDAPTKATQNNGDYSTFTDWGTNAISNGGNTANMWSTLTKDEWVYIFEHHTKGWSTVNGVNGYVIRPDGVSTAVAASYTASEWAVEETAGSVFLPAGNSRGGTTFNTGSWGDYWSSTFSNSSDAYYLYFHSGGQNPSQSAGRFGGRSVRLVYETPYFTGTGTEADPYLISSAADWNYLAVKVNSGTSYSGKFFRQTANIDVTTMVGISDSRPFSGTYDGNGNTLNLSLNTTSSCTAPFQYIVDATIKNVVTTGTVYSTSNHPSGLVGFTDGTCTIQNCRVSANVGGAAHSGGIVGHCYHANISIIGCVYSGTLSPASGQWTGGIIGWGGDDGGHTIRISNCLFAGDFVYSTSSTKFHPIGILQNQSNTKYLSNTYYTLGAQNTTDDASFVKGLDYKGKFARSITAGTDVTVANAGAAIEYDVSGITSYGTGILYDGTLYAGNGEAISLTLSHADAPAGFVFSQYTVTGGGSLNNPTSNSPTLTMSDANQTINAQWSELITYTAPTLRTGLTFNGNKNNVSGSAQNLVNAGSVSHGTIYYSTNGGSSWSTSVPQGTNAGSYTVHYKVEPDAGYSGGVASTSLGSTTIAKANGWCELSPTSSSGWGSISILDSKIGSFTVSHHGGGLSYVKGGSQQDNISVTPNGNSYALTCTYQKKISSAVTITVTSAATANYNAASAIYTCNP